MNHKPDSHERLLNSTRSLFCIVALFVRHPIPGCVKTRLARDLGDVAACNLYRAMVTDIITSITTCELPLYLFHDGRDAIGLPAEWIDAADDVIRQTGDSLGDRMTEAFNLLFTLGIERVILTGSDIPGIDMSLLQSAIAAIDETDTVIAPALDGGYCLVASKRDNFNSTIFREIPWSTSHVLHSTLSRCHAADLSYRLLAPRRDIDTLNDIQDYCKQPSPHATSTNTWLVTHGYNISLPKIGP